ncbi:MULTISPECIES: DUF1048 domain-containing protein [Brevibacterium]|uniref:DUF1048 domain-containing protein n=1 Tax=Brevibacterium salitolerans TaxID=1403566 RepID=A0ABN2WAU5_9MICO|nr:DUF1048 domain-containing protein [Brevibacterium sp.]
MAAKWIEYLTGSLEQKKQYRQSVARIKALPEPYLSAAKAGQRYLLVNGPVSDADTLVTMFDDFVELWERAAADATPLRAVVGDDPVEFIEAFAQAYAGRQWIDKERERLRQTIDGAERRTGEEKES